jgi:hypothetical protein
MTMSEKDKVELKTDGVKEDPKMLVFRNEQGEVTKQFDISTEKGILQVQAWGEAVSSLIGKQGNELGSLRKFKAEMAPATSEADLLSKVSELRESGEHNKADELMVAFTRRSQTETQKALSTARENEKTWREYFRSRKDLLDFYDEDEIRTLSESRLDLASVDNPFEVLDSYWKPKLSRAKSFSDSTKVETQQTVVQSTGGTETPSVDTVQVDEENAKAQDTFESILDEINVYKQKA